MVGWINRRKWSLCPEVAKTMLLRSTRSRTLLLIKLLHIRWDMPCPLRPRGSQKGLISGSPGGCWVWMLWLLLLWAKFLFSFVCVCLSVCGHVDGSCFEGDRHFSVDQGNPPGMCRCEQYSVSSRKWGIGRSMINLLVKKRMCYNKQQQLS